VPTNTNPAPVVTPAAGPEPVHPAGLRLQPAPPSAPAGRAGSPPSAGAAAPPSGAGLSRVTVVAPRTRIDLALPSDIPVAHLLPTLLGMAGEAGGDGGSGHGGWCLATLTGEIIDPDRSLSSLGVLDGDLLQLRRRSDSAPPPLFDDVVEAVAQAQPGSYRPWTPHTARVLGMVAAGAALLGSAAALLRAGTAPGLTLAVAALAALASVTALITAAVLTQVYRQASAGVLVGAGALPVGFVAGLYLVPGGPHAENLLLACVLVLVLACSAVTVLGAGIIPFTAAASAAALGALAFLAASLAHPPAVAVAAAAAAGALGMLPVLPRLTIQLARLPLPKVPSSAGELQEDPGLPDLPAIERRAARAHEYLTGMIVGAGAVSATGAVLAAQAGALGIVLAVVIAAVLMLRARCYANATQAVALVTSGMVTLAGLIVGLLVTANPLTLLLGFGGLLGLAAAALITGFVVPHRQFSPVLRHAVDVVEAVLIASVLPIALGVMGLYHTFQAL
jgi:type VII secretion integral membrane protein EccD